MKFEIINNDFEAMVASNNGCYNSGCTINNGCHGSIVVPEDSFGQYL
ncbi:MAG: hypothetical protein FWD82_09050 [Defluviitaleaceae bacterium]|nr:hypothetical protein [Defluviitaleaceae bacterium]